MEIKELIKKNKIILAAAKKIRYSLNRVFRPKSLYYLLNNKQPLSALYGLDRGRPIDRYYIENFIQANTADIKGYCLELLNDFYIKKFGADKVVKSDILDIDRSNKKATIYGDLRNLSEIPDNTYDCFILTQVFQFIDNLEAAIKECHRVLKPGGTLLATLPSLSRIDCVAGVTGDYWRFTCASAAYLFSQCFTTEKPEIKSLGNVQAAINFLAGVSVEEIDRKILDFNDSNFPCLITVRVVK